jgi:hypothetical protein
MMTTTFVTEQISGAYEIWDIGHVEHTYVALNW